MVKLDWLPCACVLTKTSDTRELILLLFSCSQMCVAQKLESDTQKVRILRARLCGFSAPCIMNCSVKYEDPFPRTESVRDLWTTLVIEDRLALLVSF